MRDVFAEELSGWAWNVGSTGVWTLVSIAVAYFAVRTRYPSVRAEADVPQATESATLTALDAATARLRAAMPPVQLRALSPWPALVAAVLWTSTALQLLVGVSATAYLRDVLPQSMFVVPRDSWDAYEQALSLHFAAYQELSTGTSAMLWVPVVAALLAFLQVLRRNASHGETRSLGAWWPSVVVSVVASAGLAVALGTLVWPAIALVSTLVALAVAYVGLGRLGRRDNEERRAATASAGIEQARGHEYRIAVEPAEGTLRDAPEDQTDVLAVDEMPVSEGTRARLPLP
jgi:hypothetical protein